MGIGSATVTTGRGFTVIFSVACVAHCPPVGVNVYEALLVLSTVAGLHVPEIPLSEVPGNTGAAAPAQKGGTAANEGVTDGLTVTFKVVEVAHCPGFGVKI
jgi:hypothetical protein